MIVNLVVEGASDVGATTRLVEHVGHAVGKVIDKRGKGNLDADIGKYATAASWQPWILFRDTDGECPVALAKRLTPAAPPKNFQLRFAHTMTEAWLLADRRGFASYFSVSEGIIPTAVEDLPHAKRALLDLCQQSTSRSIRRSMLTSDGSVGPLFVATLNDYARTTWDVDAAVSVSDSLGRASKRLKELT